MKKTEKMTASLLMMIGIYQSANSQATQAGFGSAGHTSGGGVASYYLGWDVNSPIPLQIRHDGANYIDFHTAGVRRARVTTGDLLTSTGGVTSGTPGDGIRIMPKMIDCPIPSSSFASLDMWTSCSNGTNIRWGESGQISGANSQFHNLGINT